MTLKLRAPAIALAAVVFLTAPTAMAQEFPSKPVVIVVGPGPDAMPRLFGHKLTEMWGQPVVVEPQPGGGGIMAMRTVTRAAPDGHAMLLTTGSYTINEVIRPNFPLSLARDFSPAALIGTLSFMLLVHPSVPAQSLQELLKLAREKPGQLNCASSGVGTTAHLGCEMLSHYGGVKILHVPYKGVAPALNDMLAGRAHVMFSVPTAIAHVQSGALRALAVTGPRRLSTLPDVPTVAEAGLPDLTFSSWNGLHLPANTPKAVVAKINADVAKVRGMPDVQKRMQELGFTPEGGDPESFTQFVSADIERWRKAGKDTRVQVE